MLWSPGLEQVEVSVSRFDSVHVLYVIIVMIVSLSAHIAAIVRSFGGLDHDDGVGTHNQSRLGL